jgi:6-pyruvoyltetrahydropterin/6-carboxytetrahydropterin synthase
VPPDEKIAKSLETSRPMFRVTQQIDFCYGHRLLNYEGKCKFLHGHNGRAVISLEGEKLDERGMLVDFTDIKRSLRGWIDSALDHRMILHRDDPLLPVLTGLNEPVYVIPHNPTAENIARLIFEYAQEQGFPVVEVELWETRNSSAAYRQPLGQ